MTLQHCESYRRRPQRKWYVQYGTDRTSRHRFPNSRGHEFVGSRIRRVVLFAENSRGGSRIRGVAKGGHDFEGSRMCGGQICGAKFSRTRITLSTSSSRARILGHKFPGSSYCSGGESVDFSVQIMSWRGRRMRQKGIPLASKYRQYKSCCGEGVELNRRVFLLLLSIASTNHVVARA
jgi:hypothetical protein